MVLLFPIFNFINEYLYWFFCYEMKWKPTDYKNQVCSLILEKRKWETCNMDVSCFGTKLLVRWMLRSSVLSRFDIHWNIMIHILPQFNLASLKDCTEVFHVSAILLGLSLFQISSFKYPANVLIILWNSIPVLKAMKNITGARIYC